MCIRDSLSVGSTMLSGSRLYAKERLYIGDNEDIRLYQVETGNPVFQTDSYLDLGATNNTGSNGIIKHGNRGSYGGSLSITNNTDKKSAEFKSGWGGVELYYCVDGESPNLRFSTTETGAGVVGILTADRMVVLLLATLSHSFTARLAIFLVLQLIMVRLPMFMQLVVHTMLTLLIG